MAGGKKIGRRYNFSLSLGQILFLGISLALICGLSFTLGLSLGSKISEEASRFIPPSLLDDGKPPAKPQGKRNTFFNTLVQPRSPVKPVQPGSKEKGKEPPSALVPLPAQPRRESVPHPTYLLQVASLKRKDSAEKLCQELKSAGYPANISFADQGAKGRWYRVRLGGYASKQEAQQAAQEIRKEYKLNPYILP